VSSERQIPRGAIAALALVLTVIYFAGALALLVEHDAVAAATVAFGCAAFVALGARWNQRTTLLRIGALLAGPPFAASVLALVDVLNPAGVSGSDGWLVAVLGIALLPAPLALVAAGAHLRRRRIEGGGA
jgi:hypothetical protein